MYFTDPDDNERYQHRKAYGKYTAPSDKDFLFYRTLLMSPTYWKVHEFNKKKHSDPRGISFFDENQDAFNFYKKAGDVYSQPFEVWWEGRGAKLFKRDIPDTIEISLDATGFDNDDKNKAQLKTLASREVSNYFLAKKYSENAKYDLGSHSIQVAKLVRKIGVLESITFFDNFYKNKLPQWRYAVAFGMNENRYASKGASSDSPSSNVSTEERGYLSDRIREDQKSLLTICENAARGRYLSTENVTNKYSFDDIPLYKILSENRELDKNLLLQDEQFREQAGGTIPGLVRHQVLTETNGKKNWHEVVTELMATAEKLLDVK